MFSLPLPITEQLLKEIAARTVKKDFSKIEKLGSELLEFMKKYQEEKEDPRVVVSTLYLLSVFMVQHLSEVMVDSLDDSSTEKKELLKALAVLNLASTGRNPEGEH